MAREHRASFGKDKRNGGYIVYVKGPKANRFAGREVPVSLKDGNEEMTTLGELIHTFTDDEDGKFVAMYTMQKKDRKEETPTEF